VELLLTPKAGVELLRVYGEGYGQYMNLKYLGVDCVNTSISGDMRLYRSDIGNFLVASCTDVRAYNQPGFPELRQF
jgi:hypothetical protein